MAHKTSALTTELREHLLAKGPGVGHWRALPLQIMALPRCVLGQGPGSNMGKLATQRGAGIQMECTAMPGPSQQARKLF